ncbi:MULTISPECIES: hypothetical protein [Arthrobacter]|uniref:Uncharacterized protein n=1 Tax=Arthrobacter caoxuetaonis TaxID=2886935 RepID=A0A9X1ME73_9MICC|nr:MULTISPECIES: hypothetical protein [Arthrobacter]MCC3283851.1 hypothetical protein [Arthrobacter caoxuetaonis]MCC3297154.1 hypothetical protein [Arthrobacter caoxuetaonis]MCC9194043.1 hypothetical protein [Arthrobacter sp. zg-Y916]USQ58286.1 hypothetical protein NF551_05470 [Arthrobacter caoxuetaonis]
MKQEIRLAPGMIVSCQKGISSVKLRVMGASRCDGCSKMGVIVQVMEDAVVDNFHYWKGHVIVMDRDKISVDSKTAVPSWTGAY